MSNIGNYLDERLKTVELQINRLKTKKQSLDDEINSIGEKQKTFSKSVDVTYEIFSPKPVNPKENLESVQILEVNKYELISQKQQLDEHLNRLLKEQENIKNSMSELKKMEEFISKVVDQYHLSEP